MKGLLGQDILIQAQLAESDSFLIFASQSLERLKENC